MNNKLRAADIKIKTLKTSVDNVTTAFKGVTTASGEVSATVDGGTTSTNLLQGAVAAVDQGFITTGDSVFILDGNVRAVTDSTNLGVEAVGQMGTGLGIATTAAGGLVTAMNAVTQAALQAAQAIAAANAAQAGASYARNGGPVARYFAAGGPLSRGRDTQMIMAQSGERIINARNARRFSAELQAINAGSNPVYRDRGGPVTNIGDINVSVSQGETSSQTAREIATALRRELRRGTSRLN